MEKVIESYLEQIKVGRKQSHKNLAVFPLLSPYVVGVDYILLDDALTEGVIEVGEVNESGSVPELKVVNKSQKSVLILDGEELVGAKQNRIVNTTILIQGNSTAVIPVSCVEQGRWSYDTAMFHSKKRMMSSNLRAMKARQVHESRRRTGSFRADQGAIWDEISAKAERMGAASPSMAMASIYEKEGASLDEYVNHFKLTDMQVGAVFAINGKVVGLDAFGKPETFADVYKKLLQSYALDAIDWVGKDQEGKVLKGDVTRFLEEAGQATVESSPSVGLGTDARLQGQDLSGFALALDDQVLHLSVFMQRSGRNGDRLGSRMLRFSNRRRFRS